MELSNKTCGEATMDKLSNLDVDYKRAASAQNIVTGEIQTY
jgi:hypothetical protein